MPRFNVITIIALLGFVASSDAAAPAVDINTLASLPVREVTIFKDGHAFVTRHGEAATDDRGHIVLDKLPVPVMGTFWPYADQNGATLTSVVAGNRLVSIEQTAMSIPDLLHANVGKRVRIRTSDNREATGVIESIPTRSSHETELLSVVSKGTAPESWGDLLLLRTHDGVRTVAISQVREVEFVDEPASRLARQHVRPLMTMKLKWNGDKPAAKANVGMTYLQKGLRWVPNYRITIDGKGKAIVELQATLINELADLDDVTANLVIGVPRFAFDHTVDPIAMRQSIQQATAQLSQYFQTNSQTAHALSNAMMTQVARSGDIVRRAQHQPAAIQPGQAAPQVGEAAKNEDLFLFTVEHLTLGKGERMVVPVTRFEIAYKDVYTLDLPIGPPPEMRRNFNNQQQHELAKLLHAPKFMHQLRLTNDSAYPLTTAPAIVLRGKRVVAQGMMTYTPIGGANDLTLTQAIDLRVATHDRQMEREANVHVWNGGRYDRVAMAGSLKVTNRLDKPVAIEVRRHVLGFADETAGGSATVLSYWDWSQQWDAHPHGRHYWWYRYGWPHYWWHVNSVSRIEWKKTLQPGETIEADHTWHYFTG